MKTYTPKKWDLSGLQGISDATLEMHFGLYEGYVKNTNTLIDQTNETAPRRRRCGIESEVRRARAPHGLGIQRHATA